MATHLSVKKVEEIRGVAGEHLLPVLAVTQTGDTVALAFQAVWLQLHQQSSVSLLQE